MLNYLRKTRTQLYIFLFLLSTLCFLIYGASLSCQYHIKLVSSLASYDGVCKFGRVTWIETLKDNNINNTWKVRALSFAYRDQIYFFMINRKKITTNTKDLNNLDLHNLQRNNISMLNYGTHKLSNNKILFFSQFPSDSILISDIHGKLSLLSSN